MKNLKFLLIFIIIFISIIVYYISAPPKAQPLLIAVASDLKYAMDDIVAGFRKQYPDVKVEVVMGSSGKFYQQIINGAPYHLYFSADITYPQKLQKQQLTAYEVKPYAIGRIVLWSRTRDASQLTWQDLTDSQIRNIAIANPNHAPYGKRAQEALEHAGLWDQVQDKLVFGENIAQAAHFVYSGAADIGIIALSLALSPNLQKQIKGNYYLIEESFHQPLEQGYVILKGAENHSAAIAFSEHVGNEETRAIFRKYGFALPDE